MHCDQANTPYIKGKNTQTEIKENLKCFAVQVNGELCFSEKNRNKNKINGNLV